MPQVINMNIASLNAQRNLNQSQSALQTSLQRLSSGLRINSAKDDAAGMAITERFTSQIRGLNQATRNANDAISLSQTAEGALAEVSNNLQRIRELAVQSANSTNSTADRSAMDIEVQQRMAEINRVAGQTSFNGLKLLDGTFSSQQFQIGANAGETITMTSIGSAETSALGLGAGSKVGTAVAGVLAAGELTINTFDVGVVATRDAKAIAAAINANTSITGSGVTATATNTFAATFTNITNTNPVTITPAANLSQAVASSGMTAGDLTINGSTIVVGASTDSADALASAINLLQSTTGVTATAQTTDTGALGAFVTTAAGTYSLTVGGVSIQSAVAAGVTAANIDTAVTTAAANLAAAGIGTSGTAAAGTLRFTKADGSNVDVVETLGAGGTAGGFFGKTAAGTTTTTTTSKVVLTSAAVITVGGNSPATAGLTAGTTGAVGTYTLTVGDGVALSQALAIDMSSGTYGMTLRATDIVSKVNNNATLAAAGITASIDANGKVAFAAADGRNVELTEAATGGVSAAAGAGFAVADAHTVAVAHYGSVSLASTGDLAIAGTAPSDGGFTAGSFGGTNVLTIAGANAALTAIDSALSTINGSRASLGGFQNRFESTIANLQTTAENLTSSRSRIQDADYAQESAQLTRGQIMQQAGVAMLAQANALPNNVLSLLRG